MTQNIFLIHGAYGNGKENWFPYLRNKLEGMKCKVIVPVFPTPKDQTLENWLRTFQQFRKNLTKDSILVGHSIGATFCIRLIENLDFQIKSAYLVAGVLGQLGIEKFDMINRSFYEGGFDNEKIRKNCKNTFIINSSNDPYIPLKDAKLFSSEISAKLFIIDNAGHFNSYAGYAEFPLLLQMIRSDLE